jgi:hypothetical protein
MLLALFYIFLNIYTLFNLTDYIENTHFNSTNDLLIKKKNLLDKLESPIVPTEKKIYLLENSSFLLYDKIFIDEIYGPDLTLGLDHDYDV